MTPRIKQTNSDSNLRWFAEALLNRHNHKKSEYDLSGKGPIFELLHPALIKVGHIYNHSPESLEFRSTSGNWNFIPYNDQASTLLYDSIPNYGGFPWQIFKFLKDKPDSALIHFGHIGSVFVSRSPINITVPNHLQLFHHALPIWLDYALSPELWGPDGKWTRFHTTLHTLFEEFGLLIGEDFPGFYTLKTDANYLADLGFKGSVDEENLNLTFPWDFPLSGIRDLEKKLRRGP